MSMFRSFFFFCFFDDHETRISFQLLCIYAVAKFSMALSNDKVNVASSISQGKMLRCRAVPVSGSRIRAIRINDVARIIFYLFRTRLKNIAVTASFKLIGFF